MVAVWRFRKYDFSRNGKESNWVEQLQLVSLGESSVAFGRKPLAYLHRWQYSRFPISVWDSALGARIVCLRAFGSYIEWKNPFCEGYLDFYRKQYRFAINAPQDISCADRRNLRQQYMPPWLYFVHVITGRDLEWRSRHPSKNGWNTGTLNYIGHRRSIGARKRSNLTKKLHQTINLSYSFCTQFTSAEKSRKQNSLLNLSSIWNAITLVVKEKSTVRVHGRMNTHYSHQCDLIWINTFNQHFLSSIWTMNYHWLGWWTDRNRERYTFESNYPDRYLLSMKISEAHSRILFDFTEIEHVCCALCSTCKFY